MWTTGADGILGLMLGAPADPEWARAGVTAADARLWVLLGVSAQEAARLSREGTDPADVVVQWWTAGVPLAEVAAWLCAGMAADEAVQQRAAGVTVEQAQAFRALQGLGGLDA
ncbi:MAG: hypothetical protein JWO60_2084 [Frankiales bacterium]|nr:hypothetical protein [Frankiales bacterium]